MVFVDRVLGRLTASGEPLTILFTSGFDDDMVIRTMTVWSGVRQQYSDEDGFCLERIRFLHVLVSGEHPSFGPSTIFVRRPKQNASSLHEQT